MQKSLKSLRAFTLIECLVALAILAILVSISFPVYSNLIITNRINAATSALHIAILYARSEAIKRGGDVVICRSSSTLTENPRCDLESGNEGMGWGVGWIIFHDADRNRRLTPGDEILQAHGRVFERSDDGAILPTPSYRQISFNSTGQVFGNYMRFLIRRPSHDQDASHDRYMCMASGGRVRIASQNCVD